jgi:Tfp pilus assembly protein PilN
MKQISLLPVEYKKQKTVERKTRYLMIASAILSMMLIFGYVIVRILSTIPQSELKVLQAENELLLDNIKALNYLSDMEDKIDKLAKRAQEAVGNQPDWPGILLSIGQEAPDGLLIKSLAAKNDAKACTMGIEGSALSHTDIALWIDRIKKLDKVTDVMLQYSNSFVSGGVQQVSFKMELKIDNSQPFKLFREEEK